MSDPAVKLLAGKKQDCGKVKRTVTELGNQVTVNREMDCGSSVSTTVKRKKRTEQSGVFFNSAIMHPWKSEDTA